LNGALELRNEVSSELKIQAHHQWLYLSIFSSTQLVPSSHFQSKPKGNFDFCAEELCPVPVVLQFFLDFLADSETFRRLFLRHGLFLFFLLRCQLRQARILSGFGLVNGSWPGLVNS
jgi:hypothetical protein